MAHPQRRAPRCAVVVPLGECGHLDLRGWMAGTPLAVQSRIRPGRLTKDPVMKRQLAMMAGLCVLSSSAVALAWDAESRDSVGGKSEWRGNTHLFIVEKAIDLLK